VGHLCFMRPLKNEPAFCERVLYVFYDLETTQDTRLHDKTSVHVPNLVCLQQLCSKCDSIPDNDQDCIQCGKCKHTFWDDPVGDMLSYLCESRPWVERIIVIAHNAKAFDLHFVMLFTVCATCTVIYSLCYM
jgi:ribosomal protein S27AE